MLDVPLTVSRRSDLGQFLRARRSTLRPVDVGLEDESNRRHVAGLRREEVAKLAGISTTWYTWIEQAREINFSLDVIDEIGRALLLTPPEIAYLKVLASDAPPQECTLDPEIPDALRKLVELHRAAPAYLATPRLDLLVWNSEFAEIFDYHENGDLLSRNVLWRMFYDPSRRQLYVDWETAARGCVAVYRNIYATYYGDEHFDDLLVKMMRQPDFVRMWSDWEVLPPAVPAFMVRHQTLGLCELEPIQATLGISPGCYLALFSSKKLS
ncbi:MAG TPA: helix-turn-helix transcriptional regulator [Candidatus Acidoferrum sp.]|jgi:transcriptional regulator with XRE-family HTH domain|nr:helix-turn-helix transcriptional regulator [Candidatus Acidoferrum sp.]